MRIDFATLSFGYKVKAGGGTPNWATALGQGSGYKINSSPAIDEILKGMVYSSAPLNNITTKIGKGGRVVSGDAIGSPIILAAVFNKVYINTDLVENGKFILLITRDDSDSHAGRLRLKYGPSNTYIVNGVSYSNQDLFDSVRKKLSLTADACWFVSNIRIKNQNELILKTCVVKADGPVEYEDSASLHAAWSDFDSPDDEDYSVSIDTPSDGCVETIEERILAKYREIKDTLPDFDKYYKEFEEKFSAEMLQCLEGEELLKYMFLSEGKENMCWFLEFHPQIKEYFGSISGGTAFKYGLYFDKANQKWITGTALKKKELTLDEAVEIGTGIRDSIVNATKYITNFGSVSSVEDYVVIDKKLNEIMGDANKVWLQKYFHMIFPALFAPFTNDGWQNHVLFSCGITPRDGRYVRSGQISLFANGLGISNAAFAQVVYQLFGGIKHFYRLGTSDASTNYFADWVAKNYGAVGWSGIGDLAAIADKKELSKDAIIDKMMELYYPEDKNTASRKSGEVCNFYNTSKDDSYFVAMDGKKLLAIGRVNGDYFLDGSKSLGHCKPVEWVHKFAEGDELPVMEGKRTTCVEIDENENLMFLYNALNDNNAIFDDSEVENPVIEEETMEMNERKPRTNLSHDLNCIIYGAPGTGKTYSTVQYAVDICDNKETDTSIQLTPDERTAYVKKYDELVSQGRIVFTTFHQSYGYEDFIQGLRPDTKSENMRFVPVDGVFKKIADIARKDEINDYVIIIDEINRGQISKIFGELITLIEDDKRWGEKNQLSVILPSGQRFAVPNNLYIVGTMNSADKSISLIDTALRRRFVFIEQEPQAELVADATLKTVLERVNELLRKELDSTDLLIGHSYFMGKTKNDLCNIMNRNIIPLLYEYFFDNSKKVKTILQKAVEGFDFEVSESTSSRLKIAKKG